MLQLSRPLRRSSTMRSYSRRTRLVTVIALASAFMLVLCCVVPVSAAQDAHNALIGTWKIQTIERETLDTGDKTAIWSPPAGFQTYTPDGRMSVILVSGTRKPQAGLSATDEEAMSL